MSNPQPSTTPESTTRGSARDPRQAPSDAQSIQSSSPDRGEKVIRELRAAAAKVDAALEGLDAITAGEVESMGRMTLLWRQVDPDRAFRRDTGRYLEAIALARSWYDAGYRLVDIERAITVVWPRAFASRQGDGIPHPSQMATAVRDASVLLDGPLA